MNNLILKTLLCSLIFISAIALADEPAQKDQIEIPDRIEIRAPRPAYQQSLSKVLPQQQVLDETSFSSDSLATLLSQAPAINLNGQGGLFQTINIRGFARWRIQTLVEGIPIYTERRAGTSVEFLPPGFIGGAYLTQGAASTQLGSGAIGGGIDLSLSLPDENQLRLSYGDDQDHRDLLLKGKIPTKSESNSFTWQINHRHSNNSEDGKGDVIQDAFEHNSLLLRNRSDTGFAQDSFLLYSRANNIAKASAEDPQERFTLYPENHHLLGKMVFDWHNAAVYFHESKLQTLITRPGTRVNNTQNDSLDFGLQLNDKLELENWLLYWRATFDARSGVRAFEREVSDAGIEAFARLNLNAEQWEVSLATDFNRNIHTKGTVIGGARIASQYQEDKLSNQSKKDSNLSAFIGYAHPLYQNWQISAYLSNAYRVPSLTERFFNGTTPRGKVLGDADLKTETAINFETSLTYQANNLSASVSLFKQDIDNYIERLTINDELLQDSLQKYSNLDSAEIQGINYQIQYEFDAHFLAWTNMHWKLNLGGQWLDGEDQTGKPVADIAPPQHRLTLSAFAEESHGFIAITHRQSSDDIVPGELPTDSVTTIDAGYSQQLNSRTRLSIHLTNITDQTYLTSRDDLAPYARGRDLYISVEVRF